MLTQPRCQQAVGALQPPKHPHHSMILAPASLVITQVSVLVESDSQRPILLGSKGAAIKQLSTDSRLAIEEFLGAVSWRTGSLPCLWWCSLHCGASPPDASPPMGVLAKERPYGHHHRDRQLPIALCLVGNLNPSDGN